MMPAPAPEPLEFDAERAERAWRQLGLRLRSITPSGAVRILLVASAAVVLWRLVAGAWTDLLPFQFGLALAYITLPLVNGLSRIMPRQLAALVLVVIELAVLVGAVALLVPPVVDELTRLVSGLPNPTELQTRLGDLRAQLQRLPEPTRLALQEGLDDAATGFRSHLLIVIQGVIALVFASLLSVLNTFGFIIAFLGIPTWLVAVLSEHRRGIRALNRVVPAWAQPDLWAVLRILDRTFGTYVRGQLLLALFTGVATFLGLWALEQLGIVDVRYRLVLAMIAGVMQLIPTIGPILAAVPALITGFSQSPEAGLAILLLYVGVQQLRSTVVAPRVERRSVDLHPALVVVILVLLSPFGLLWVLLAAPLAVAARDLFRYVYGRFGDPPCPAGLLPGQPLPKPLASSPRLSRL
jgi:predicted PurR-regulated permease PerM